ncbi:MAG: tetratricopeptide repeat protein [Paludibacter sp.]
MKLIRILFLFFAVILLTPSCSRINKQLLQAEELAENAPDSAMTILKKYSYNNLSDKDKALYGLVYMKVLNKLHRDKDAYSYLNFSTRFYEQEHTDHYRLSICYHNIGRKLFYENQYEKAMLYLLKANDLVAETDHNLLKNQIIRDMAGIHYMQGNIGLARKLYYEAYKYFLKVNSKDRIYSVLVGIGRTYCTEKKYNKSLSIYRQITPMATDSFKKGILMQELGLTHYRANHLDSAKYYYKKSISLPYESYTMAFRLQELADIYYDLDKYDSALFYSKKALTYATIISIRRNCYRIIANCSQNLKMPEAVKENMGKYQDCSDSIIKINSQTKAVYLENMFNMEIKATKSQNWIWYSVGALILIILGSVYIYIRKHKKSVQAIEQSRASYNKEKTEMRKDVLFKKRAELLANVERIKSKQKGSERMDKRVKDTYNELLHVQDTALFFCEMDKSYNNIVTKLQANAPDIKEKEVIWCCLHLLDVPTHDILILLDYETINSLKRMKGRLALKLGLENATLLNDYLLQLLTND